MKAVLRRQVRILQLWRRGGDTLWHDETPIRAELFGTERLEDHARTLAAAQPVSPAKALRVTPLSRRLKANGAVLLSSYRACAAALHKGETVTPAAEWLLDNYHLVEQQLRQITDDLPPGYYRQLPKLADGPFAGYPRVFGIAWAYVAHTDSLISRDVLARFVQAYQGIQPLTIGEIWAIAISLRIILIENMRRLSVQIVQAQALRAEADMLVDRVLGSAETAAVPLHLAVSRWDEADIPEIMAGQIAKRLRGFDPADTPLAGWLDGRLARQGTTPDEVVEHAQSRQGASNLTMRNIVTSMRLVSEVDWADFFEDVSLIDVRLNAGSDFAAMDFATRNCYRTAIEEIARGSALSEAEVATQAMALAAAGSDAHQRDPGYPLIGEGRPQLERLAGFRPPVRKRAHMLARQLGPGGYIGLIAVVSAVISAAAFSVSGPIGQVPSLLLGLLALAPAIEGATAIVNLAVTRTIRPAVLPGMALEEGVPDHLRTLVVVPVLLSDEADLLRQIEQLEVHHLSSTGGAVHFALLSDGPDAATETVPQDAALIDAAARGIARLNAQYPSERGDRFLLLHRRRLWNPSEGCWMGWERKRGKLVELNGLLRGATDTTFLHIGGTAPSVPPDVRHVITLDADTRLLRDTVRQMVGKMAHPLNTPRIDGDQGRVTGGYGILQPRVTPALPVGHDGSLYQRIFSSPGGIEPYAAAVSDVYQDLFDEGSFTGKGIYHVDAFAAALKGRVPENALLSHDLFEGIFARAGLASDIEVVEDFPARYDVDARRQHRWVRGDWQLWPWLCGSRRAGVPAVGRWKMFDNLRRSLVAPMTFAALLAGWLMPLPAASVWTVAILAIMALPRLLPLPFAILPGRAGITSRSHFAALGSDAATALGQIGLNLVLLPATAWMMLDAVLRTIVRLVVTRRHLLEWVTAAQSGGTGLPGIADHYRAMAGGLSLGIAGPALVLWLNPSVWPVAAPFGLLWCMAPALAQRISRPRAAHDLKALSPDEALQLRLIARRTWAFFETFVTEADSDLPPDNFQESPDPVIAHRTSPTNIGLYLLSTVVAREMGWIGQTDALDRLERTLAAMGRMARYRGHFYNWYDTRDLRVLDPPYVSSVDSGNLAGHLIAVARACEDWRHGPLPDDQARRGLSDTIEMAERAIAATGAADATLSDLLAGLKADCLDPARWDTAAMTARAAEAAREAAGSYRPGSDVVVSTCAVETRLSQFAADASATGPDIDRLDRIAATARNFAMAMEFGFLLAPEKKLLSVGFSVATNMLDASCYDLLASECRLASLFAIAKGDVETRHWFRLGRAATPLGAGSALISWSGSMFEYLMPSLVMRAPAGSLLEQTSRLIVAQQQSYAAALGIPWGISESSYNARDLEMTYQYSNFGVPGLGLKRGLAENRVIAPYATGLATMVDPQAAIRNYARLAALGAEGRYGFFEAIDFTATRLPAGSDHAIVRSFMAHHQGMTITAIANALQIGRLRDRFHSDPIIMGVELLLQERVPRDANAAQPHAEEVRIGPKEVFGASASRRFADPGKAPPTAHLLSNGRYGVMLTPTGAGYSRWRDLAITRWRADPTRDALGSFIYLRDVGDGTLWSAGVAPLGPASSGQSAYFNEHHASFTHEGRRLSTRTEVVVSAQDDAEGRRVSLTNTGRQAREIDLTSYAELVLAPPAADLAHPAFSKMFVVTDYMPELGVLIATRRKRSPQDPEVWAAHIAVAEGDETALVQIETDRARFIGRGRSPQDAAITDVPLSGTTGTVLDPIFSIRRRISVPPGGRARVTFWTLVADSPDALLELVDRHRHPAAFDRAETLAWTQAQVQLRHLGITHSAARDFQRLAGVVLRGDPRLRSSPARIAAGAGRQSGLWPMGISGDLPIVLMLVDDTDDMAQVHEVLAAQEYWRMRQFAADLVILNERSSSYVQDLQIAVEAAMRSAQLRPRSNAHQGPSEGSVRVLRSDLVTPEARALLMSVAAAVLVAGRGSIGAQLDAAPVPEPEETEAPLAPRPGAVSNAPPSGLLPDLEFFNGTGGFAEDGREYVTILRDGQTTPAPWINVIANPNFGFQVSADGSGHVWSENSRENQLTQWSNDPVTDPAGDAVYLCDLDDGSVWTPTASPVRRDGTYVARHGFGYSRFAHERAGIAADMVQFVPMDDPVRITHLTLRNTSARARRLSVTAYAEWVLGTSRTATLAHLKTSIDAETGAIFAVNPWSTAFPDRVAFADFGHATTSRTAGRAGFLGRYGSMSDPAGLRAAGLAGQSGPALDPCAALQRIVTLAPGETVTLTALLGQTKTPDEARALILRTRAADPLTMLDDVKSHWAGLLTAVQVRSPDRATDIMLNGWLLYQTLACRVWARAGFYQASGAYGFRDQLQDGMALTFSKPEMTREHLLRAAARQFPEGDVQHWWLPHSGQGVRTRISDDRVWLGYGVARYVGVTGDTGILDEAVPFLEGPDLSPGAHDAFFQPGLSDQSATLFEHCARALDQAVALTGANGMPLIGTGDWNDGMNRVGEGGQGTSVWLGWLLIATIDMMAPLADGRDKARATRWRAHAKSVLAAIERDGWDGEWYRRGTYDDGSPLGSAKSLECRIDSIAQSWAVLSGAADAVRAARAMASMTGYLVRPDPGIALLFTPPFNATPLDPGYIKGYPPGLRENGGQYSHAAMWAVMAHARRGDGDAAGALFALLNPINHALTPDAARRYKVEPYVIAADVYSAPPHEGRGGWTWYTGSAGWMYRAGIEGLLGLTRRGGDLLLDPCFPGDWPRLEATVTHETTRFEIMIDNPDHSGHGILSALLDGAEVYPGSGPLVLPLTGRTHHLQVRLVARTAKASKAG